MHYPLATNRHNLFYNVRRFAVSGPPNGGRSPAYIATLCSGARRMRERARSFVATLTVSLSCTGGAARENVVGGAGPVPNELSVCLSVSVRTRLTPSASQHSQHAPRAEGARSMRVYGTIRRGGLQGHSRKASSPSRRSSHSMACMQ